MSCPGPVALELVTMRERANRLLRRITTLVQKYEGDNVDDAVIGFCTENTLADCLLHSLLASISF
jgi:hypothetical protein